MGYRTKVGTAVGTVNELPDTAVLWCPGGLLPPPLSPLPSSPLSFLSSSLPLHSVSPFPCFPSFPSCWFCLVAFLNRILLCRQNWLQVSGFRLLGDETVSHCLFLRCGYSDSSSISTEEFGPYSGHLRVPFPSPHPDFSSCHTQGLGSQ